MKRHVSNANFHGALNDTPVWWPSDDERRAETAAAERRRERAREARRRVRGAR